MDSNYSDNETGFNLIGSNSWIFRADLRPKYDMWVSKYNSILSNHFENDSKE